MKCPIHKVEYEEDSYCDKCAAEEHILGRSSYQLSRDYTDLYKLATQFRECLMNLAAAEAGHQGYTVERTVRQARSLLTEKLPPKLEIG